MKTYESVWHATGDKCANEKSRIADLEMQLRKARTITLASEPPDTNRSVLIFGRDPTEVTSGRYDNGWFFYGDFHEEVYGWAELLISGSDSEIPTSK